MIRWVWLLLLATGLCADVVVLMGPPGAGKGTLGSRLSRERGWIHLSTGDLLREEVRRQSHLGQKIQQTIDSGHLISDALMEQILFARLEQLKGSKVILDGYPRNEAQAGVLETRLGSTMQVIALDAPDETLVARLSGRRICVKCSATYHIRFKQPQKEGVCDTCRAPLSLRRDDTELVVRERLSLYHEVTEPIRQRFQALGTLRAVDASGAPDTVFEAALEALR